MSNTQNKTPKLRFPEFEGEWKKHKLEKISSKIGSGKTPLGGEHVYQKVGINFIRSQNVLNDKLNLDDVKIPLEIHNSMLSSKVLANDILLNITGGSIGRSCVVPADFDEGNVNQHVAIIRLIQNDPKFLQSILSSWRGQKLIYEGQTGSGREGLNFESIKSFKIAFPSLPEQLKIATFLTSIDARIQLLERKKAQLEAYKKGVMQELFSQRLRFKQEDGSEFPEWEEKRLVEVCTFFSGGTPSSTNKSFYSGDIPFIGSGEISSIETEKRITQEALNSSSAKMVERGDLLYALYGATSGEVAISKISGAINQAVLCIRTSKLNSEFLFHLLKFNQIEITKKYLQGGQGNLSAKIVRELSFYFPSLPEQRKIATFLGSLDAQIEAVGAQIGESKEFKRGLLQEMFV